MNKQCVGMDECPVKTTVNLISGKWKPLIVYHLLSGKKRFGELQHHLSGITHRSLSIQLRDLESDGLISRKVYAVVPPKVEYQLTELGSSMSEIIEAMFAWGIAYNAR